MTTTISREAWSAFIEQHPNTSIFHTPQMHDVFAEARRHRPTIWATIDASEEVRAIFTPVSISVLGGPLRALTTRTVAFAGPLVGPDPTDAGPLDALLDVYSRRATRYSVFTEIRNVTDGRHLEASLSAHGFRHEAHLNFLVDLTGNEDQVWARVTPSARRNVRKAERMGVRVEEARDAADVDAGYEVLRHVYRRIHVPLPDVSLFHAAHRRLGPSGQFQMLLARQGECLLGVTSLLRQGDVVTYWYTGSLRAHTGFRAGDLLAWKAIETGRANGCRVLDFGGAGRPDVPYGVRDFKAKYGGTLVDYGRDIWKQAPIRLRIAESGYRLARKFVS